MNKPRGYIHYDMGNSQRWGGIVIGRRFWQINVLWDIWGLLAGIAMVVFVVGGLLTRDWLLWSIPVLVLVAVVLLGLLTLGVSVFISYIRESFADGQKMWEDRR